MLSINKIICLFFLLIISFLSPLYAAQIKILKVNPHQLSRVHQPSSCLNGNISLSDSNNIWYTQATFTVVNNCGSPQDLNNAVVSFQSNSVNLTPMWDGPNRSAAFTYQGNIARTVLIVTTGPLGIGQQLVFNFGINLQGIRFDLTSALSTLSVVGNSPTPTNGEIDVTVDPTGVSNVTTSSEIDITGPGLTQPYIILNSSWNTATTYKVIGLAYGNYQINALPIDTRYTGNAAPSSVLVNSATPVPVKVTYTATPATGALAINLSMAPMQNVPGSVNGTLTDNTTNQNQVINIAWNTSKLIQNLPVGHHYSLTFPQVSNGVSFSMPNAIPNPIITQNRTTPVNVSYQTPQPTPSQSVVFHVSGLTDDTQGTLTIVDSFGNQFVQSGFGNGEVTQALPLNDSFAVSASAADMFASVTPSSFVLTSGSPSPSVNIVFTPNPPSENGNHFYAYADTSLQANNMGLVPPVGANMVEAYILYNQTQKQADLLGITKGSSVAQIIQNTPNTIASVGGLNGPFPWDFECAPKAVTEIESLVDYYHFIGIDFDVEGPALDKPAVQTWVAQAALQLRQDYPDLIITLTVPDPVNGYTTSTVAILNQTLNANNRKMVFDWINKLDFNHNGLGNGCSQTDTNMANNCLVISASSAAQQLANILNINQQQAFQYVGEVFKIPTDDQGHALSLSLATQVATTLKNMGVTHLGYWRLQNDDANLSYGNMYTHVLGLS